MLLRPTRVFLASTLAASTNVEMYLTRKQETLQGSLLFQVSQSDGKETFRKTS